MKRHLKAFFVGAVTYAAIFSLHAQQRQFAAGPAIMEASTATGTGKFIASSPAQSAAASTGISNIAKPAKGSFNWIGYAESLNSRADIIQVPEPNVLSENTVENGTTDSDPSCGELDVVTGGCHPGTLDQFQHVSDASNALAIDGATTGWICHDDAAGIDGRLKISFSTPIAPDQVFNIALQSHGALNFNCLQVTGYADCDAAVEGAAVVFQERIGEVGGAGDFATALVESGQYSLLSLRNTGTENVSCIWVRADGGCFLLDGICVEQGQVSCNSGTLIGNYNGNVAQAEEAEVIDGIFSGQITGNNNITISLSEPVEPGEFFDVSINMPATDGNCLLIKAYSGCHGPEAFQVQVGDLPDADYVVRVGECTVVSILNTSDQAVDCIHLGNDISTGSIQIDGVCSYDTVVPYSPGPSGTICSFTPAPTEAPISYEQVGVPNVENVLSYGDNTFAQYCSNDSLHLDLGDGVAPGDSFTIRVRYSGSTPVCIWFRGYDVCGGAVQVQGMVGSSHFADLATWVIDSGATETYTFVNNGNETITCLEVDGDSGCLEIDGVCVLNLHGDCQDISLPGPPVVPSLDVSGASEIDFVLGPVMCNDESLLNINLPEAVAPGESFVISLQTQPASEGYTFVRVCSENTCPSSGNGSLCWDIKTTYGEYQIEAGGLQLVTLVNTSDENVNYVSIQTLAGCAQIDGVGIPPVQTEPTGYPFCLQLNLEAAMDNDPATYYGYTMDVPQCFKDNLPLTQPFNTAPWFYAGNDSISPDYTPSNPCDEILDWVLVQVEVAGGVTETKAAVITRCGYIASIEELEAGIDGCGKPMFFSSILNGESAFSVTVRTRNHLPFQAGFSMDAPFDELGVIPCAFMGPTCKTNVFFGYLDSDGCPTEQILPFEDSTLVELGSMHLDAEYDAAGNLVSSRELKVIRAGNSNGDNVLDASDWYPVSASIGATGYHPYDLDYDCDVDADDQQLAFERGVLGQ